MGCFDTGVEYCNEDTDGCGSTGDLEFEARIDRVCLAAFEIYLGCREQVFELKANEMRNRTFRAFKRAGLVAEPAGEEPQA